MKENSNPQSNKQLATLSSHELSLGELTSQVNKIQEIMHVVMKEDVHYGTIPGTKAHTLYKAGAEKLNLVFRLSPAFDKEVIDLDEPGHREYRFTCTLTHLPTGLVFGEGYGSCSTMESKYLYRTGEVTPTDKPVPKEYWNDRDINLIGGKGFATKKIDGKWEIVQQGEKVKHDNPADYWNTCLKMGKKRAAIDATLSATAASDIFKQDLIEDGLLNENIDHEDLQEYPKTNGNAKPDVESPKPKDKKKELINTICDEIMKLAGNDVEKAPPILLKFTTFEGKNNEVINGTSDTADLYNYSEKRLGVLHGKLKKEIEEKGDSIGDENAEPPNE